MLRLYAYEWKKLWKKKINVVCLVLLIGCTGVQIVAAYQNYINHRMYYREGYEFEGVQYQGLAAVKHSDSLQEPLYGTINEEWFDQYFDVLEEATKDFEIDEQAMQDQYGPDWRTYYEKFKKHTLTNEEYSEIYPSVKTQMFYDPDAIVPLSLFTIQYVEDVAERADMINYLYRFRQPFYMLDREHKQLTETKIENALHHPNFAVNSMQSFGYDTVVPITHAYTETEMQAINDQLMDLPTIYDKTSAYEYLTEGIQVLGYTFVFMMILLAFLLCGIFNQEHDEKTDQLLRSVQVGEKNQAISKILVALTISSVFVLAVLVCVIGIPALLIGYGSFSQAINEWPITMRENILLFSLLLSVSCISYCAVYLFLSSYIENKTASLFISLVWVVITCLGGYVLEGIGITKALTYLPGTFVLIPFHYEPTIVFGVNIMRSYLIAGGWLLVSLALLYFSYRHYHCRDITNA